jgi:hypothetical protein
MVGTVKQQAFQAFDLLTERQQVLVCELIQSLNPDNIASDDDIAVHAAAAEAYRRGETVGHNDIDWS